MVAAAGKIFQGLWYPVVAGLLIIRDWKDVAIHTWDGARSAVRPEAGYSREVALRFSSRLASASLWASSILPIAAAVCASSAELRPGRST